jgi:hypothetical protein
MIKESISVQAGGPGLDRYHGDTLNSVGNQGE